MGVGAPIGNRNAAKGREFYDMLRRVMAQDDWRRLRAAAEKLADAAAAGEPWAISEVANRLDGKPKVQTEVTVDGSTLLLQTLSRLNAIAGVGGGDDASEGDPPLA